MRIAAYGVLGVIALGGMFVALWVRERRAHSVFSASEAASLLHPARRLIYPPRRIVASFGIEPGQRVLEVGPGPGYFTTEAVHVVGRSGQIVCADLQPGMIDELQRRLDVAAEPHVRMLAADAMHLPFADGSFDSAFLVAVLGEVPHPPAAVVELRRVLRVGGVVSFFETLTDPDYVREGALRRMCRDAGLEYVDRRRQPLGYIMRFSRT